MQLAKYINSMEISKKTWVNKVVFNKPFHPNRSIHPKCVFDDVGFREFNAHSADGTLHANEMSLSRRQH